MPRRSVSAVACLLSLAAVGRGQDVNDKNEEAMRAAAAAVAPSVVKIETSGGAEVVGGPSVRAGGVRKGVGPTTGLVVAPDGYVISSAFNFANKPADIIVTVPGRPNRFVAKVVANDTTRMLTLLKIDAQELPVPPAFPKADVRVGQWAVAVGRTLSPDVSAPPSVSAGVVSATGRIWGKAIQTDAKVSPVNYGGPLVAIDGRVFGVLVPASPRGEGEAAGVEWYDSGIGFAVPFEDVLAAFPRLKQGKDLRRGLLGVTSQSEDVYNSPVVVGTVSPDSAAAKAGIKPGDKVVALDGRPVENYSQLMHVMGPKYEGDTVAVKAVRDGKEMDFPQVVLSGVVTAYATPFLGILPLRDDPEPGVEVRYVYPDSPAAAAGLKPGDRILKVGPPDRPGRPPQPLAGFGGRNALASVIGRVPPGEDIRLEVKAKADGKTRTVTAKLATVPEALPEHLPLPSSAGKALEKAKQPAGGPQPAPKKGNVEEKKEPKKDGEGDEKKEPATGLVKRTSGTLGREYWVYVPPTYNKNVSHGLVIWLHEAGKGGKDADDFVKIWQDFCAGSNYILVGPRSQSSDGWVASETEAVVQVANEVIADYTIDRNRVVAHGKGTGGQMAFYLGFNARDLVRGVATTGAALGTQPKDNTAAQPLSFFVVAGEKDPLVKEIAAGRPALLDKKFPVVYRQLADFGKEYLLATTFRELLVWIDSLDRI